MLRPNTARPATPSPMTIPPLKLTLSAFLRLVLAASVVRTLAAVAMRIPMFPANAENTAPITKATTINQWVVSTTVLKSPSKAPATTTKMANKRYSALKKARAPRRIYIAISAIRSFPIDCLLTQEDLRYITTRANKATAGTANRRLSTVMI